MAIPFAGRYHTFRGNSTLLKALLTMGVMTCLWVAVMFLFCRQWRIIRDLEPTPLHTSYCDNGLEPYEPLNIGRIRVVGQLEDTFIHGSSPEHDSRRPSQSKTPSLSDDEDEDYDGENGSLMNAVV